MIMLSYVEISTELDTENYKHVNNPKAWIVVKNLLEEQEYMNAWRILNESKKDLLEKNYTQSENKRD